MNNENTFSVLNQATLDSIHCGLIDLGYSPGEASEFVASNSLVDLFANGWIEMPEVTEFEDDPVTGLV